MTCTCAVENMNIQRLQLAGHCGIVDRLSRRAHGTGHSIGQISLRLLLVCRICRGVCKLLRADAGWKIVISTRYLLVIFSIYLSFLSAFPFRPNSRHPYAHLLLVVGPPETAMIAPYLLGKVAFAADTCCDTLRFYWIAITTRPLL